MSDCTTEIADLAELRAALGAMTPAPWRVIDYGTGYGPLSAAIVDGSGHHVMGGSKNNMPGIVALRNAVPELLDRLEAVEVERDEARATVEAMGDPKSVGNPAWLAEQYLVRALAAEAELAAARQDQRRWQWAKDLLPKVGSHTPEEWVDAAIASQEKP